jgi:signal transduction histidine kinase
MNMQFLKRIKVRIALTFSILFLFFAIPAIFYASSQVNLFFTGMHIQQMRIAGLTASTMFDNLPESQYDSLTTAISQLTSTSVFLIAANGALCSRHYVDGSADTSTLISIPILNPSGDSGAVRYKFIQIKFVRYLQLQTELPGRFKLLQVKSFTGASELIARMQQIIIWSSFLGLVALIAVAFWVSAKITQPIEELTEVAQKIRLGHLPDKTNVKSPDEVGDLADALNEIIESLSQYRARLARLESMRRDFFGNINEKLEHPVKIIRENLEFLKRNSPSDNTEFKQHLDQAREQTRNLKKIIHTLIELSELEFGEMSLEIKAVPIKPLIEKVTGKYQERAALKGLALQSELPPELSDISVEGDFKLLRLALDHLVSNAIEFTAKGWVKISVFGEDGEIRIQVKDTGDGIPDDRLDRIFERFYQIEPSPENAGLGLAIVKHILDAHERKIEVESIVGVGSKFSFWLRRV